MHKVRLKRQPLHLGEILQQQRKRQCRAPGIHPKPFSYLSRFSLRDICPKTSETSMLLEHPNWNMRQFEDLPIGARFCFLLPAYSYSQREKLIQGTGGIYFARDIQVECDSSVSVKMTTEGPETICKKFPNSSAVEATLKL